MTENIFSRRGIPVVVNAAGTLTRLSGAPLAPGVAEAMAAAGSAAVDMVHLQAHASDVLAALTGAEAGCVTSGAAAGLTLATAACIAGLEPALMARLPDTRGMRNEVVVARSQRNGYDHSVRAAGARLVEVGLPELQSGAGGRDTEPSDYADAVTERTAAILYVADRWTRPDLAEVVQVARRHGVPVVVDAAAQLPPQQNLRRFIALGADLVVFSGGKALGGPGGTGLLLGRRRLIMSALLQMLDMDVDRDLWDPPQRLIDKALLSGLPRHGLGRGFKVSRQDVIGLLVALEHFVAEGDAARHARWLSCCREILDGIGPGNAGRARISGHDDDQAVPRVELAFATAGEAMDVVRHLLSLDPPVHLDQSLAFRGRLAVNPQCLRGPDIGYVAAALSAALARLEVSRP